MKSSELSKEISEHNFSLESVATTSDQKEKFCEIWPTARKGLELLRDHVRNPIVKGTITLVISTGDGVAVILGCNR